MMTISPRQIALLLLMLPWALAQAATEHQTPPSLTYAIEAEAPARTLGEIDMAALRREFPIRPGEAAMFATAQRILLGLEDGAWTPLDDSKAIWRLQLQAPSALSLNAVFSELKLPPSARLHLVDHEGKSVGPPIEARHVAPNGRFYSAVVPGSQLSLELIVDEDERKQVRLFVETINQGFRAINGAQLDPSQIPAHDDGLQGAGGCNIDISCPIADDWQDVAASVARFTVQRADGSYLCTGQMIAAENGVSEPYFLTANHCFSTQDSAESVVLYFNYRSPTCRSAISGERSGLPPESNADIHYGGTQLLASNGRSDFTLVRLNQAPADEYDLFYTGWDRRDMSHSGGVHGIHHPDGTEKRYSYSSQTAIRSDPLGAAEVPNGFFLKVAAWDEGTTEGGSSGSGLWNADKRLVGQLYGGFAACGNNDADWYGRLTTSWDGGRADNGLKEWLDPNDTGVEFIDGRYACAQPEISIVRDSSIASVGELVTLRAQASGGSGGPYLVQWDTTGDGEADLEGATINLRFDQAKSHSLTVTAYDSAQCQSSLSFAQTIRGPSLSVSAAGDAQPMDGTNQSFMPGSRWRLPVRVENTGDASLEAGVLSFTQQLTQAGEEPYRVLSNNNACNYDWIAAGSSARELELMPAPEQPQFGANDEGRSGPIPLRHSMTVFDDPLDTLYLSSNGYLTSSEGDGGDDYLNRCPLPARPDNGALGTRLLPYHDDLVTNAAWTQSFNTCPRPAPVGSAAQGCTVISWQEAEFYDSDQPPFAMQAIIYEDTGQVVYQYQTSSASRGGAASIGLQDAAWANAASYSCNQTSLELGNNAVCILPTTIGGNSLKLETPSLALADSLAPGESVVVDAVFQVRESAACGDDLGLYADRWAGLSAQGSGSGNPLLSGEVPDNCTSVNASTAEAATPRPGLWWNPERSGNGLDIYPVPGSDQMVVIWYTATADRQPVWYLAQGPMENGRVQADLRRFSWNGSRSADTTVGSIQLDFVDSTNGLLQWRLGDQAGSERVEAFLFGTGPGSENSTGLWYDPGESGWGLTFNNQLTAAGNDVETAIAYFYDNDGEPVWMLGQSEIGDSSTPMRQYSVSCPQCPWSSASNQSGGSIERRFDSETQGEIDIDLQLQLPLEGRWQRQSDILRLTEPLEP